MVTVPHRVIGRTRLADFTTAFRNTRGATPGAFGAGVAHTLGQIGTALQEEHDRTRKFNTLADFSEFQTQLGVNLEESRRNIAVDGTNYVPNTMNEVDSQINQFLATVPDDLKSEFEYRTEVVRGGALEDTVKFNFQFNDTKQGNVISDEVTKAQLAIEADPSKLGEEKRRIADFINSSTLATTDKQEIARTAAIALESVAYKALVIRDPNRIGALGVGDSASIAGKIIGVESGGDPNAKNPFSSATGSGQFINSTWLRLVKQYRPDLAADRSDREILELRSKFDLSFEMVDLYSQENARFLQAHFLPVTQGTVYLAHFLGPEGARQVLSAPQDTDISTILSSDVLSANKAIFGKHQTAGAVINWAEAKMAGQRTSVPDPRFGSIPFSTRVALRNDAFQDQSSRQTRIAARDKQTYDQNLNNLLTRIHDGQAGMSDIITARRSWLNDFDDIRKAEKELKRVREEELVFASGMARLTDPKAIWNPNDKDHKKQSNAIFKSTAGQAAFENQDADYVRNVFIPQITRTRMIPSDALGMLEGMMRNPQQAGWAYDVLNQVRTQAPIAFNSQLPDAMEREVNTWDQLKEYLNSDEIVTKLNDLRTPEGQRAAGLLRETAEENIKDISDGTIADLFDPGVFTIGPDVPSVPRVSALLRSDFNELYIHYFGILGDDGEARKAAGKSLQKSWGSSTIGGERRILKYPPEKSGYETIDLSFDWIDAQARQDLDYDEDVTFYLVSDRQTEFEVNRLQRDPENAEAPSYLIWRLADDGLIYPEMGEDGITPRRIFFDQERAEEEFRASAAQRQEDIRHYDAINEMLRKEAAGEAIDPQLQQELEEAFEFFGGEETNSLEGNPQIQQEIQQELDIEELGAVDNLQNVQVAGGGILDAEGFVTDYTKGNIDSRELHRKLQGIGWGIGPRGLRYKNEPIELIDPAGNSYETWGSLQDNNIRTVT